MNTMHKILLAIVIVTANNHAFTLEQKPTDTTVDKNANLTSTVITKTPAQRLEEKDLAVKNVDLKIKEAETAVEKYESTLVANKDLKAEDRAKDPELIKLKKDVADLKITREKVVAEKETAWVEAYPKQAKLFNFVTGAGIISYLGLTGNKATCVKAISLVTAVAATVFVANKAYEYFFKEEIENEEEL